MMKRFLVLTLVLTIILPAYCFANPESSPAIEENILNEIMWALEDRVIDETELDDLVTMYIDANTIDISQQESYLCSGLKQYGDMALLSGLLDTLGALIMGSEVYSYSRGILSLIFGFVLLEVHKVWCGPILN